MRDICKVIKFLTDNVIPKEHVLQAHLDAISKSAMYTPPELQREVWHKLCVTLASNVPKPTSDWEVRMKRIINDEEKIDERTV